MDKIKLSQLVAKSPTAKAMFKHFLTRDRNPKDGIMDLRRTKYALQDDGIDVVSEELVSTFKTLEEAGVGKLITEKGKPVRFRWTVKMKETAEAVLSAKPSPSRLEKSDSSGNRTIVVLLADGGTVSVSAPAHISNEDLDRLCAAIKNSQ